jgi:hypothetical protein
MVVSLVVAGIGIAVLLIGLLAGDLRIDEAYERVVASGVRYRFVIDTATISG